MAKTSILQRIGDAAEKVVLSRVKNRSLFAEYYKRGDKATWKRQETAYERKEIKDWILAVRVATDPDNPRRGDLMRFYQSLRLDLHLSSVIDTRILRVQRSSFKLVNDKGEENEELKMLLERPWFDELVSLVVGKTFNGTTLIEMFDTDENGELIRINEIPQSNFIAQKGIIVKEEWDDNGTSYREGTYKDYYLQIGNDWELGMLNQLAMIVLAKKLGLGSWMSYIEKFGVPPLFAITERMDSGRRDELFDMLQNFRMNHFAVLQGNEKIEVPNNYNVDAYQSFKSLINDVCNQEISKRVLGGTAMVDEKSFVGSAEIQERVAQDRHEADKLLFKYYFNTHIRQRLAKLSSVYSEFATYTLVWDNQETLDINGYIDAVQKLSSAFDFDIEEVRNRTGLPIIGTKAVSSVINTPATGTNTKETAPQKKKSDANFKGLAPFAFTPPKLIVFAATWDAAIERLAHQIYNGEIKSTDLDKDLVLKNYAAFNSEAQKAWGKGYYDETITRSFRENFLKFAGAKSHDLMKQLEELYSGGINKDDFITQAKGLVQKHNSAYLTTELRFCSTSVSAAQDYATYLNDVDIYPNLKCRTMEDAEVRDSHAANDGIIKPVNDWTSVPPWDYGCRCWLEQTTEPPTDGRTLKGLKFNNNPHNSGEVFTGEQNYFQNQTAEAKPLVRDNTELIKRFMPYNQTIKVGENTLFVNDFHDVIDGKTSINAAKIAAKEISKDIYILPHIHNSNKTAIKNPELGIGKPGVLADLKSWDPKKTTRTEKFVKNNIYQANKQGCEWVLLDLTQAPEKDFLAIAARKLRGDLSDSSKMNKGVKQVIIIRDNKAIKISRKQINSKNFMSYFKFE